MKVAIDISQIAHQNTGVAHYVSSLTKELVRLATKDDEFVLFGASLRKLYVFREFVKTLTSTAKLRTVFLPLPPTVLSILWNDLHIIPMEWLVGSVDIVFASDWTTPPLVKAKGVTTVHDLSFMKFPETFGQTIPQTQKKRIARAIKDYILILCDSDATKKDMEEIFPETKNRLKRVYPGFTKYVNTPSDDFSAIATQSQ